MNTMGELSDIPLEELLAKAQEVGALDRWEAESGVLVFETATMRIAIEEPKAKPFVRGLLRGYELALTIEQDRRSGEAPR